MESSNDTGMPWSEADSRQFIERGRVHIPARDEIQETILELLPAERDEPFLAVELGVGGGWLCAAILETALPRCCAKQRRGWLRSPDASSCARSGWRTAPGSRASATMDMRASS